MTGINLNVQNSYAALYTSTPIQTNNASRASIAGSVAESADITTGRGEKLTLSSEAIALSQQTSEEQLPPTDDTPTGGGEGIRPPNVTPLGGGEGIRPPLTP